MSYIESIPIEIQCEIINYLPSFKDVKNLYIANKNMYKKRDNKFITKSVNTKKTFCIQKLEEGVYKFNVRKLVTSDVWENFNEKILEKIKEKYEDITNDELRRLKAYWNDSMDDIISSLEQILLITKKFVKSLHKGLTKEKKKELVKKYLDISDVEDIDFFIVKSIKKRLIEEIFSSLDGIEYGLHYNRDNKESNESYFQKLGKKDKIVKKYIISEFKKLDFNY